MMRINVNGKYLDLYADTSLQFVRKNVLFAFDNIEVARTAEFQVPATPNNNAIFELANDPARDGIQARVRLAAELQYSGGVESGYLYINRASRDEYNIIYVYGELLALKTIKEAGKLKDVLTPRWVGGGRAVLWSGASSVIDPSPFNARLQINDYEMFRYKPRQEFEEQYWAYGTGTQNGLRPLPSFRLGYITDECLSALGLTLNRYDTNNIYPLYRLVQKALGGADGEMKWTDAWGSNIYALYNLPDIDVIELLKIEAMLQGRMLYYNGGGFEYITPDIEEWNVADLTEVISVHDIRRTFSDFAKQNVVRFSPADWIDPLHYVSKTYTINQQSLEDEKELLVIPFSEGGRQAVTDDGMTRYAGMIDDFEGNGVYDEEPWTPVAGPFTLLYCGMGNFAEGKNYMTQPPIADSGWLTQLCAASTALSVECLMPLRDFQTLDERQLLNLNGQVYVWTEAQWQDGVASLQLSKI